MSNTLFYQKSPAWPMGRCSENIACGRLLNLLTRLLRRLRSAYGPFPKQLHQKAKSITFWCILKGAGCCENIGQTYKDAGIVASFDIGRFMTKRVHLRTILGTKLLIGQLLIWPFTVCVWELLCIFFTFCLKYCHPHQLDPTLLWMRRFLQIASPFIVSEAYAT